MGLGDGDIDDVAPLSTSDPQRSPFNLAEIFRMAMTRTAGGAYVAKPVDELSFSPADVKFLKFLRISAE